MLNKKYTIPSLKVKKYVEKRKLTVEELRAIKERLKLTI